VSDGEHGSEHVGRARSGDDLMAADRRTLVIGALAMVALVLVGVVSGSLFAGSACDDIAPRTVAAPAGTSDLQLLDRALDGLGEEELTELRAQLTALSEELGGVTGVAAAPGATSLAATAGGVASLGADGGVWRGAGGPAPAGGRPNPRRAPARAGRAPAARHRRGSSAWAPGSARPRR